METTIIGVTHNISNLGVAAFQLDQIDAQRIGLEVSPEWAETYAHIYEQDLNENNIATTILEKIVDLSKDDEQIIRQFAKSQKWPKELTDYIISELSRSQTEQISLATKLRKGDISSFDKKAVFDLINGTLYFYHLYKRARLQGKTPIFLDIQGPTYHRSRVIANLSEAMGKLRNFPPTFQKNIENFVTKETKATITIREPQMAYKIAAEGVEFSFIGSAHISGVNNLVTILRGRGIKVKTRNLSRFPSDPNARAYKEAKLKEYNKARKQYRKRLKKTHDSWWAKLQAKHTRL